VSSSAQGRPARTVLVHVGAPKTGTSFVQDVLFQHREALAEQGVLYPADRFDAHFLAALDLMELRWGGLERQAVGAWGRLAEQVRAWSGTVIVSHEILATASRAQVRRAMQSFGEDSEVHVIVSVRDLVRQVPAEWQENVKHRRTLGYRAFLDQVTGAARRGTVGSWFWSVQDIPAVLDRWAADVPPERVHVVTVPRPGAPRHVLWERFAEVFRLDPVAFDTTTERANPSLGVAETALLRKVNEKVNDGVLPNERYRELVREVLAHRTLSRRTTSSRLRLPEDVHAWAAQRCEEWIADLASRGYDVVGDLEDLRPDPPADGRFEDPDRTTPKAMMDPALESIVALLRRSAEMRDEIDDLHRRVATLTHERDVARGEIGLWLRSKRAFVARAETHRSMGLALRAYRRVRGR